LKSGGSLSQQEPLRLSYPFFLPAKQHARLAIEMTQAFTWPPTKTRVRGQAPVIREAKTGKRWRIRSVRPGQPRRSQVAGGVAATPGSGAGELLMSHKNRERRDAGEGSPKEELALGRTSTFETSIAGNQSYVQLTDNYEHENQNSERRSGSRAPLKWWSGVFRPGQLGQAG